MKIVIILTTTGTIIFNDDSNNNKINDLDILQLKTLLDELVINGVYCEIIVELWMEWKWSEVVTIKDV